MVQSAQSLPLGKPHPGIFLRTAELLAVPAVDCVVLEDSLTGVIAAKSRTHGAASPSPSTTPSTTRAS